MKLFKTHKSIKNKLAKLNEEFNTMADENADAYVEQKIDLEGFYNRNTEILEDINSRELFTEKELNYTKNVELIKGALLCAAGTIIASVIINSK